MQAFALTNVKKLLIINSAYSRATIYFFILFKFHFSPIVIFLYSILMVQLNSFNQKACLINWYY